MRQCTLPNSGIHAGNLILVNSRYQYREPEPPNLVPIGETGPQVKLNRRAAALFSELMQKIGGYEKSSRQSGTVPFEKTAGRLPENTWLLPATVSTKPGLPSISD